MGISLDRIQFDPTAPGDDHRIGSFLISAGGTVITDTAGALNVNVSNAADIEVAVNSEYAEDSAHTTADIGSFILAVRNDAGTSLVDTDGDYAPLQVDSSGALLTATTLSSNVADDAADSGNPIKMGGRGFDGLLGALSASNDRYDLLGDMYRRTWVNTAPNVGGNYESATVGITAAELVSTPSAGRQHLLIQNNGTKDIFLGFDGSVTTANGIRVSKDSSIMLPFGEDLNVFAISGTAGQNVRVMEWG